MYRSSCTSFAVLLLQTIVAIFIELAISALQTESGRIYCDQVVLLIRLYSEVDSLQALDSLPGSTVCFLIAQF